MRAREIHGDWWLPEAPSRQVSGTLVTTWDGDSTLRLSGGFDPPGRLPEVQNQPVIYGTDSQSGAAITLLDSLHNHLKWRWREAANFEAEATRYRPHLVVIGRHVDARRADIHSISLQFAGMLEWTGFSRSGTAVSSAVNGSHETVIEPILRPDGSAVECAVIRLAFPAPLELNGALAWTDQYRSLMSVLFAASPDIEYIGIQMSERGTDASSAEVVTGYVQPLQPAAPRLRASDMFLTLNDVVPKWDAILRTWLQLRRDHERVLNVLTGMQYGPPRHQDTRALLAAITCEAYHREVVGNDASPEDLRHWESVLASCRPDDRKWLEDRLILEPAYGQRTRELMTKAEPGLRRFLPTSKIRDRYAFRLRDFRNKFSHEASSGTGVRLTGEQLYLLASTSEWVLRICLARDLGMSEAECDQALSRRRPPSFIADRWRAWRSLT